MNAHLVAVPILLPLVVGAIMLLVARRRRWLELGLSIGSALAVMASALALMAAADGSAGVIDRVYRVGDWPAPVAIVLVADRLAGLMVLLASILALANVVFALSRWASLGPYYHPLSQFLLMGLNGAFLTGDLFNLFVFFEVLLAASYGLLLHGSGRKRVTTGLHYIIINLIASLFILIGVSAIFGVTGTLKMSVLAELVPTLPDDTRRLFHAGAAILGVAFLVKAAAWPLGFWLPRTYDAAVPPASAMFAIMTKLGIYALIRLSLLILGADGGASSHAALIWLIAIGAGTMLMALIGMLAARDVGRLGGYNLLLSAGTLLGAVGLGDAAVTAGALFYLFVSTLGAAILFLIAGLLAAERGDEFEDEPLLEKYDPEGEDPYEEYDERPLEVPAPIGLLGAAFLLCTLLIAGIPPLPGFIAKFAMLEPLIGASAGAPPPGAMLMTVLLILSSFVALFTLIRAGMRIWWVDPGRVPPTVRLAEIAPLFALLGIALILTIAVDRPVRFMERTAAELHNPADYLETVFGRSADR